MGRRRYELTEAEWALVSPLLPKGKSGSGKRGRPRADDQKLLNGMIWILRSGAPWRDLPERYGPYTTVYTRFREWIEDGTFGRIIEQLQIECDLLELLDDEEWEIDTTIVRAHISAAGAPGKKSKPSQG